MLKLSLLLRTENEVWILQSLANKGDIYMTFKKLGQNFSLQARKEDLLLNWIRRCDVPV